MQTKVEGGKCKIQPMPHNKRKKEEKKKFKKVVGVKCREKSEKKLSQKKKVVKELRFQSQRIIPD